MRAQACFWATGEGGAEAVIEFLVRAAGPLTIIVVLFALFRARWAWRTIILAVLLTTMGKLLTDIDGPTSWLFQFATVVALPVQGAFALLWRGRRTTNLSPPLETAFADLSDRAQAPEVVLNSDEVISGEHRHDGRAHQTDRWSGFPEALIPVIGFLLVVLAILSLAGFLTTELAIDQTGRNAILLIILLCAAAVLIATFVVSLVFGDHALKFALIGTALTGVAIGVRNFDDELQLAGSASLACTALGVWVFRLVKGRSNVAVQGRLAD